MESDHVINEEENESSCMTNQVDESSVTINLNQLKEETSTDDMQNKNANYQDLNKEISSQFECFLYTKYQDTIELADQISKKFADETKPFEFKYEARELLQSLLARDLAEIENSKHFQNKIREAAKTRSQSNNSVDDAQNAHYLTENFDELYLLSLAKGQVYYLLGINFFESEEYTESEKHLKVSMQYLNPLPKKIKLMHINMIQDIYNNLGIINCNRDNHKKGLPHFVKSEEVYKLAKTIEIYQYSYFSINNNLKMFLRDCKTDNKASHAKEIFSFHIDGGIDKLKLERNYTLTLFYMAQVFTKLKKNEKAVSYCALTLKRQLETKEYDIKDWSTNCVNLAEYFIENNHFAQAEYCLFAGISILPPAAPNQTEDEKELRAMLQSQIGRYYLQRLKFGVDLFKKCLVIGTEGPLYDSVHKQFIEFPTLNLKWPVVTDITDIEQAKFIFRLGNTQFKKAVDFFILDGYVTEHSRISKDISELYKYVTMLETNQPRVFAMYERRRDLLQPIIDAINPEAYEVIWAELSSELVNIYHEMFDLKYEELKTVKKMPKKQQFDLLNEYGNGAIKYAFKLTLKLESFKNIEDKDAYLQAIINQRLAIGKIYSKLYDNDKTKILDYYSKSLENYKTLQKIMKDYRTRNDFTQSLEEQFKLCNEMIDLLPVKMEKLRTNIK